jgi:hypothetical protein
MSNITVRSFSARPLFGAIRDATKLFVEPELGLSVRGVIGCDPPQCDGALRLPWGVQSSSTIMEFFGR